MIDAFIRLMNSADDPRGPVNLGNPHEVSMREIAQRIVAITGSNSPLELHPLPTDDPWHRQPDISRARVCSAGNRKPRSTTVCNTPRVTSARESRRVRKRVQRRGKRARQARPRLSVLALT